MSNLPAQFAIGELVDIIIRGVRVFDLPDPEDEPGEGLHSFEFHDAGRRELVSLNLSYPQVAVARVAPPEWPPVAGDVWRTAGVKWFAFVDELDDIKMFSIDGNYRRPEQVAEYGAPELVSRDGWSPTVPAADPEPAEVDDRAATIASLRKLADTLEANPHLVGRVSMINLTVRSLAEVEAYRALGWAAKQIEHNGAVHHNAIAPLSPLVVHAIWIEDAAPAPVAAPSIDDDAFDATCGPVPSPGWLNHGEMSEAPAAALTPGDDDESTAAYQAANRREAGM